MPHVLGWAPTWGLPPRGHTNLFLTYGGARCQGFYDNLVKSIVARASGGNYLRSLPKLDDFFITLHLRTCLNIPSPQISIANQAPRHIWDVHCFIAIGGIPRARRMLPGPPCIVRFGFRPLLRYYNGTMTSQFRSGRIMSLSGYYGLNHCLRKSCLGLACASRRQL